MAYSKCGNCDGRYFEVKLAEPKYAQYKQNYIQCSTCGVPIGVIGSIDAGVVSDEIRAEVSKLTNQCQVQARALQQIEYQLSRIEQMLSR